MMLVFLMVNMLPTVIQEDSTRIEAAIHFNDSVKRNKVFRYKNYRSVTTDYQDWTKNFHLAKYTNIIFLEDEKQVYYHDVCAFDNKPDLSNKGKTVDGMITGSMLSAGSIVIYDKEKMIEYKRIPEMKHAEMRKTNYPSMQNTPYNYDMLGASNEYSLTRLFEKARTGEFALAIQPIQGSNIKCIFHKRDELTIEFILNPKHNYEPMSITIYDSNGIKNGKLINYIKAEFSDYMATNDGLHYPRRKLSQIVQNNKTVLCSATVIDNIETYNSNKVILEDAIDGKQSMHIQDMSYSNTLIPKTKINYLDVADLYNTCEQHSKITSAAKSKNTKLPALSIFYYTAVPVVIILLLVVYFKLSRKGKQLQPLNT